jgi:hypothetical protein
MSDEEKAVVKASGDWTNFSQSYGLKPWGDAENREAHDIVRALAEGEGAGPREADEVVTPYDKTRPYDAPAQEVELPARGYDDEPTTGGTDFDFGEQIADGALPRLDSAALPHASLSAIEQGYERADPGDDGPIDASVPDDDDEAAYALSDNDDAAGDVDDRGDWY